MLVIRLQRTGRKNAPAYRVVVAEHSAPITGKVTEIIGHYIPTRDPAEFVAKHDRVQHWVSVGAKPSNTVARLLKKDGLKDMEKFMKTYTKKKPNKEPEPEEEAAPPAPAATEEPKAEEVAEEPKAEETTPEPAAEEAPVEEAKDESPAEETKEEPKEEAAEEKTEEVPAEPEVKEEKVEEAPAEEPKAEATEPDDLTKVEGIGPKIAETLVAAGHATFADVAKLDSDAIQEIIKDIQGSHPSDTWPKQAQMAADGKWDELKKWQDELDGGKAPAE
jgi:ribosomal protein S16